MREGAPTSSVSVTVKFTATVIGGVPPYSYAWTFGDGSSGAGASATHTYTATGTFAIGVVVTDAIGQTATGNSSFTVSPTTPPPPSPGTINQIQVTTSATAAQTGVPVTVSGKAVDQYGKAMAGIALYLWEALLGGSYVNEGSATTDINGVATWSVTFVNPGTFDIVVSGSSTSPTSPVPSNTVVIYVTSPPPPPQTTFQLVPGKKVKIPLPAGVTNMGLGGGVDVGAPAGHITEISGGIGRTVYYGGMEIGYASVSDYFLASPPLIGTGIKYKVALVDSYTTDVNNNEIYVTVATVVGNDGACYVQADIDGNYLTLTFFDSLGNVLYTIGPFRPGNQYDSTGKFWGWGGSISVDVVDMDQYAAYVKSGGTLNVAGVASVASSNWGSYKVYVSTLDLILPKPVLKITNLGQDPTQLNVMYKIHTEFYDSATGTPLQAVTNPLAFGYTSGGTTPFQYQITSTGVADFDLAIGAGQQVYAFVGPLSGIATAYTPNTIISNSA